MPIYILKRYYRVLPTDGPVWHLGREVAFEATSDHNALAFARKQDGADLGPHGGLVILQDPRGKRVWESTIGPDMDERRQPRSSPAL